MKKKLLLTEGFSEIVQNKLVYLDTDFLGFLFKNNQLSQEIFPFFKPSGLMIDPLVEFEFLRDIYDPKMLVLREEFINDSPFLVTSEEGFPSEGLRENALILSKIYALNNRSKGVSFVDLMLSGRIMSQKDTLLLTGNKKDYSSLIFDTQGVLNFEDNGFPAPKSFWLISYNEAKFDDCYQHLKKVEKLQSRELSKALEKVKIQYPGIM